MGVLPTRSPMPEHRPVDARRPGFERGEAVDRAHVAIAMAVPVDAHARAAGLDDPLREPHDGPRPGRSRMADRVGDAEPVCAGVDGRLEQTTQRLRIRSRRVFGDVHHLQALTHAEADRLLGAPLQIIDRPVFRVLADGTRSDEAAALDRESGALHDVGDRLNVGDDGAGHAVRLNVQAALDDLRGQTLDVAHHVRPGARKSDGGGVDADAVEQVQDAQLLVDRRRAHRRRLQAVAQRLVVELYDGRLRRRRLEVPVEDQVIHDGTSSCSAVRRLLVVSAFRRTLLNTSAPISPTMATRPLHPRPSRTAAWLAGPMTSSMVTVGPRPARPTTGAAR